MTRRLTHSLLALLAGFSLLAAACSASSPAGGGNQRATILPTPATAGAARVQNPPALLSSSQIQGVYYLILQRFIDRVDHDLLLEAAERSMRSALMDAGALPLDTSIADLGLTATADPARDWARFASAYESLTRKFPDWAGSVNLDRVVVQGMLVSLADRHSLYISPGDFRRRNETGYSGIGIRLSVPSADQPPMIVEVFADTPAAQLGIRAGDRIIAVEGQPIAGLPLAKIVDQIRGPEGTIVNMDLERPRGQGRMHVQVPRRAVEIPYVEAGLIGSIGYLRIRGFNETVPPNATGALTEAKRRGAQSWIVDLRGNSGGRVTAVQAVAGMFLDQKTIGIEINRARERTPLTSQGPRIVGDGPVVVLVDNESTSGAEILAAALKEYRGATVVGERSAGNVAVAEEHLLPDGSAIQLTVRRFLGPSGGNLDRVGVQPDVNVSMSDADLVDGADPQLAAAVNVLQSPGR